MARARFSFKKFLKPISGKTLTALQLERTMVRLFNNNLELFHPGTGLDDIL